MSSIREAFEDSIKYDQPSLAHYIFHFVQEGIVKWEDDASVLDFSKGDKIKVQQMIESNLLGFNIIGVFALKQSANRFIFIYAKDEEEAIEFFRKELKSSPKNCHEYLMDFVIEKGNRSISFRDLKKEYERFPAIIGYYERDPLYQ
ncbi:hypothetical protein RCG19_15930 [Neobacillus sp. OS1-2]|uniref:hypothetical protein n=1 Tax=Neobacillus sp. OS1-2 TaxID=3070680 RepID=UPI0027DF5A98|nr:hypothetical protein [Neobacillus sp. OS1-2]WML38677.1 hypothetical protein RCG19_15930 [Neobacillus sp. OS1-2]